MSSVRSELDIPAEYRKTVEALLGREPVHHIAGAPSCEQDRDAGFSLGRFLKPYRFQLSVALLMVIASTFVSNVGPLIFARAIDEGIAAKNFHILLWLSMVYLATIGLRILLRYANAAYIGYMGQELLFQLRNRVFRHLQRLGEEYHNTTKSGLTLTLMTSDINTLSMLLQDGLINLVVQALVLFIITGVLIYMNATLAGILLCAVVPPMVVNTLWFRKRSSNKFRAARARNAEVTADIRQSMQGLRQIHIFNRAAINVREHHALVDKYRYENDGSAKLTSLYSAIADFIEIAGQSIVIYVGYKLVVRGHLTLGEVIAFALFLNRFFGPLEQLALLFREYQSARAALERIAKFLSIKPAIQEPPGATVLPPIRGHIEFSKVSFAYTPGEPVLTDFNLEVRQGEKLAIVGVTGGGKSTVIKLLARLLAPTSGSIKIDGFDISQVSLSSLRRQVGVVQQDTFLFHGSLRDNIMFANPKASEAQLQAACSAAFLTDLIGRLPLGLDSSVYEHGAALSAGEKQLIAISRLILADPRVILMDEATSSVDPATELRVERAIQNLTRNRTTIIVSHRLNRMDRADRVVVIGEGRILESGTHAELMAAEGLYTAMSKAWQGEAQMQT